MSNKAVIDLGFGDSGKGRVVDWLCAQQIKDKKKPLYNVRFSGGHQAGHHVVLEDKTEHVFSNFGSGTLCGAETIFSKFCTIDPVGILTELAILKSIGLEPKLHIHYACPVTTPYDKAYNKKRDAMLQHGTCGVGFGATLDREAQHYSLLASDLVNPGILKIKLELIADFYKSLIQPLFFKTIKKEADLFLEQCVKLVESKNINILGSQFNSFVYDGVIFEGSQGLLLDQDIGFFPHVTRSNTGLTNVIKLCNNQAAPPHTFFVTRAYQTRHGNGPMTNEGIAHNIKKNPFEQNLNNGPQGAFRTTLLDVDLIEYALAKDSLKRNTQLTGEIAIPATMVITCLDLIKNDYRFTYRGEIITCEDEQDFLDKLLDTLIWPGSVLLSRQPWGDLEEMVYPKPIKKEKAA